MEIENAETNVNAAAVEITVFEKVVFLRLIIVVNNDGNNKNSGNNDNNDNNDHYTPDIFAAHPKLLNKIPWPITEY